MVWHFEKPYNAPRTGLDGEWLSVDDYMRIRKLIADFPGDNRGLPAVIEHELRQSYARKHGKEWDGPVDIRHLKI